MYVQVMSCVEEIEGYEVCIVVDEGHRPFTVSVQCEPQGRPTHLLVSVNCNDRYTCRSNFFSDSNAERICFVTV